LKDNFFYGSNEDRLKRERLIIKNK